MIDHKAEQQKEIATIRPRRFDLRLSDADIEKLYYMSYRVGITPAQLIEGFVGDLVCGTYSNGSDERFLLDQYYHRCGYIYGANGFLAWILREYGFMPADIEDSLDFVDSYGMDLLTSYRDGTDKRDMIESEFAEAMETLREAYTDYCAAMQREEEQPEPFSDGLHEIRSYLKKLQNMKMTGTEGGAKP